MDKNLKHDLRHEPKEVEIELDKKRTLRFDLNAYSELDLEYEDKNRTYHQIEKDVLRARPYAIKAFLWAGLLHEEPELTLQDVGRMVSDKDIGYVLDKIYTAILDDYPKHKEPKKKSGDTEKKGK